MVVDAKGNSGHPGGEVANKPAQMKEGLDEDQDRKNETAKFQWPPMEEDLRRLYLGQKLSAMKISRLYGLKYPNPKSGESMVLYYLKRFGIKRRDKAEHIRKVTEEMADEWVQRYQKGESLKQIAGGEVSPVTVFLHLRKRGVQLRDKIEALIETITKHPKTTFSGDPNERAYLIGFARGDLYVTRHGRAIRVKTGTTHQAMIELFQGLFGPYGPVYVYPRKSKLTQFEWSLDSDLDQSFQFMREGSNQAPDGIGAVRENLLSFIAGLIDTEGSILMHRKSRWIGFEITIVNMNQDLLESVGKSLSWLGYSWSLRKTHQKFNRAGIMPEGDLWRIEIVRYHDVRALIQELPLRHPEKKAKGRIALKLYQGASPLEVSKIIKEWESLTRTIKAETENCIAEAGRLYSNSHFP